MTMKGCSSVRIPGIAVGEDLDRDRPAQNRVGREVDVAHPASGDVLDVRVARRKDVGSHGHDSNCSVKSL